MTTKQSESDFNQCEQIGQFIALWATFQSLSQSSAIQIQSSGFVLGQRLACCQLNRLKRRL